MNNNNNNNKKQSQTDPDLKDQVDCVNRSLANLRSDIPEIVRDAVRKAVLDLPRISPSWAAAMQKGLVWWFPYSFQSTVFVGKERKI